MKRLLDGTHSLERFVKAMTRVAWAALKLMGPLILLIWSAQRIIALIAQGR